MAYDATAKALGIKAIGTVESGLDYTAINYNDPITVGVMQWYGTRAASLLRRMRTAGQGASHFDVSGSTNTPNKWRTVGGAGVITQASDGVTLTQNSGTANPYIEPSNNTAFTGKRTFEFTAVVSVSVAIRVRAWVYPGTGATGPGVPAWTQITPAMGKQTLTFRGEYDGVAGSFVRFIVYMAGATATVAPMNAAFTVHSAKAVTVGSWTGVAPSIESALDAHGDSDVWWNDRFLTKAEGESLRPVLAANKAIQNTVSIEDMEVYKNSAVSLGIDPEGNTQMMLLFFTALHQSPARARRLIATIGPSSSFDRLLSALLNEEVFKRYRTRYNTAAQIILSGDTSGVETPPPPVDPADPGGDVGTAPGDTGATQANGGLRNVRKVGDVLYISSDAGTIRAPVLPNGEWLVSRGGSTTPPVVPPTPEPNPEVPVPPTGAGEDVLAALAKFMTDRVGKYAYSQGGTRMEPDKNNYTDCSGLVRYAYQKVTGVEVGTYTVEQLNKGTRVLAGSGAVDESKLKIGDLVLYNWRGGRDSVDHVEMYIGNGQVCGHGGPGNGPTVKTLQGPAGNALNWYVNRYV